MKKIKTKMDALEIYRKGVLPRIIKKYEKDPGSVNHGKRREGWDSFVKHLSDINLITKECRLKWLSNSHSTSFRFLTDLYKNLSGGIWLSPSHPYPSLKESFYKGHPTLELSLKKGLRLPFRFGLTRAVLILECIDEIRYFVEKYKAEDEVSQSETPKRGDENVKT